MKTFRQYLAESVRTYNYKIKVAGDCNKNWLDMFMFNLQKFDPVKIGEPKSTPIQKDPYGFPQLKNQSVWIIEVEFRYPCTEPMVKQIARLLNYDENMVRMIQAGYDDSITKEAEEYANQASHTPILDHTELEDNGKEASKEYADQYMSRIRASEKKDQIEMPYAGEKTKPAFDPFDQKKFMSTMGNKSPMTTITRPPRPETGARK